MIQAVLLVSHGTVDDLGDLAAFVTNVRRGSLASTAPPQSRGHSDPPSLELVAELRRRYESIGGRSPLNAVSAEVARKLGARLGVRVAWANRLWMPTVRDVAGGLVAEGVRRAVLVPLAQHSAGIYADDARRAVEDLGLELVAAPNWGQAPELLDAFALRIFGVLSGVDDLDRTTLLLSAHSLPKSVIEAGDGYERDVRASADAVLGRVKAALGREVHARVAFQSQGMSAGPRGHKVQWLGPNLEAMIDDAAARGHSTVVFAPVGFLADHVEILYDLDIEAKAMAGSRGLRALRTPSLNADDDFIEVLAAVARPLLSHD